MSANHLPQDHTTELSVLINTDRVRSSIKRLFRNSIAECLGEMFQNSQRARATRVEITTREDGFAYADDGHGLLGGVHGFHTLLKLAESNFDNETITEQDPMGLGIHSLLAHDKIRKVTFSSGNLSLTLETARWWKDAEYYSRWYEQLRTLEEPVAGLHVSVECEPELIGALRKALDPKPRSWREHTPAQGYKGILEITLDGRAVETGLPGWACIEEPILKTKYQGCPITIGYGSDWGSGDSTVNWYGQLIKIDFSSGFEFHLEVRKGRPVNPLSPSRQGIIKDAAYEALIRFVKDALFDYLFNPKNRAEMKAKWVSAYYRLDAERANREAIYIVAQRWKPASELGSMEDLDLKEEAVLLTYEESPLLIDEGVTLLFEDGEKTDEEEVADNFDEKGLSSFIPAIGEAYELQHGDRSRLAIGRLWWKPGPSIGQFFREAGEYGISFSNEKPEEWKPVTSLPVFSYTDASNWNVEDVEWTVGCENTQEAKIAFLRNEAWAGFDPENDEADYDVIRDSYEQSINGMIREIVGHCVERRFDIFDLTRFMKNQESRIRTVEYLYEEGRSYPEAIKVTNDAGEEVKLRLM